MAIATELSSPSGVPSAADWVAAGVAAASETSITAPAVVPFAAVATVAAADSIITAADAAAVNTADAVIAVPLAAVAGNNDDNAITTLKQASVISSAAKISLDKRQRDNQPDKRHKRGRWQQKQQQLQLCNNQQKRNGTKTHLLSHREVAAHRLTWRRWLRNCRGGSNDDYNVEMTKIR